jgi:uncharacterized protein YbgA (DUF1722 family)
MSIAGDNHEERISKLEAARQLMEDSLLAHATLESRASTRLEKHQSLLEVHEETMLAIMNSQRTITSALGQIADSMKAFAERMNSWEESHEKFRQQHEIAMRKFDDKLNALISIVGYMQGGMESRPNG